MANVSVLGVQACANCGDREAKQGFMPGLHELSK